ncbi:MAG: hypothetical protein QOF92_1472 [Pseudonocardiales bacterium]|nr:hypothetical protein [Pseudonocardiales bacterium]
MRRSMLVLAATVTAIVTAAPAAPAVGPGGWDHVGVGSPSALASLNGHVTALNTQAPGALYVGGSFTSAGGNPKAARIARWNGATWSALGNTPLADGGVFAIAYHAGKVFAGGTFHNAGGNANADFLAVWDPTTFSWAPFCNSLVPGPAFTGNVNALQVIGNTLYVGGAFQNGAGIAAADYLVACDLTTGVASPTVLNDGDFSGAVYALTADSTGKLYAGGGFINLATIADADHVAAYDNGTWQAMGTGIDTFVRGLHAVGTNVYVGTDALNVAGIAQADHVARWDGAAWHAVGANTAGTNGWFPTTAFINALTSVGSLLIAAGSFQNANGVATADDIAYFDGYVWRPLGSDGAGQGPYFGNTTALASFGGKVFAAGSFTKAGGDSKAQFLAAYALRQPDAWVGGTATGQFVGNNLYSPTGSGESRTVSVARGKSVSVYVKIQNDGLVTASFTIKGSQANHGITTGFYRAGANITARMRAGTYPTGNIGPRAVGLIRVVITATRTSAAAATFVVTARSVAGTTPDAVRIVVHAH